MTLVVSQIIDETRRILADKGVAEKQRNKDADIRGAMRMSVSDMRRVRPDFFLPDLETMPDSMAVDSLDIEDWLFTPITFLCAGYILMQHDQYSQDGTASGLISAGRATLNAPSVNSQLRAPA